MDSSRNTLSDSQLRDTLSGMPEWSLEDGKLVRSYAFPDFLQAMEFVNTIARLAEQEGHHPDIDIRYNKVKLGLVSHDAGGITQRDARMARLISSIVPNP